MTQLHKEQLVQTFLALLVKVYSRELPTDVDSTACASKCSHIGAKAEQYSL